MRVRGVVVAGGRGTRLGQDRPKALAVVAGRTLLARAIATLARMCEEIVVTAPTTVGALPPAHGDDALARGVPVRWVEDRAPGGVPLAGVVAGLADEGFERAIVLAVDFPLVSSQLLSALLNRLAPGGMPPAVVPAPGGRLQPLLAAYARGAARPLREAFDRGERSVVRAVEALRPEVLRTQDLEQLPGGLAGLLNLNTPEDLAAAEAALSSPGSRA